MRVDSGSSIELFDRFVVIAGPCAVESPELLLEVAGKLTAIAKTLGFRLVFKASFDKANRSKGSSFRSIGFRKALDALAQVKERYDVLVLTDVHEVHQVAPVADVVDILQIPAFLCRQTDLIVAAARSQRMVAIKKGQFMAPEDMKYAVEKAHDAANPNVFVIERGTTFGYHNLVVDMRSLAILRRSSRVVFDATHSVQRPGSVDGSSGGDREFVPLLARAAAAAGIDGLFIETHPDPVNALSDGANMVPLADLEAMLAQVIQIHRVERSFRDSHG